MDIVLERILTLIPRKESGKFVHGAKKAFADKIGLNHPQIISDWIAERNSSYKNYLYVISAKYNVSVEWLKGETDDPTPLTGEGQQKSSLPDGRELKKLTPDNFKVAYSDMSLSELHTMMADIMEEIQGRDVQ